MKGNFDQMCFYDGFYILNFVFCAGDLSKVIIILSVERGKTYYSSSIAWHKYRHD